MLRKFLIKYPDRELKRWANCEADLVVAHWRADSIEDITPEDDDWQYDCLMDERRRNGSL
jgi:hypothetical protein